MSPQVAPNMASANFQFTGPISYPWTLGSSLAVMFLVLHIRFSISPWFVFQQSSLIVQRKPRRKMFQWQQAFSVSSFLLTSLPASCPHNFTAYCSVTGCPMPHFWMRLLQASLSYSPVDKNGLRTCVWLPWPKARKFEYKYEIIFRILKLKSSQTPWHGLEEEKAEVPYLMWSAEK